MISDAIALYELIRRIYADRQREILGALFDSDGNRLEGNERLSVTVHPGQEPNVWWYSVDPLENHLFIRIPVNAGSVIESLGTPEGEGSAHADYFRYVRVPDGRLFGGPIPSVKVSFMIFGYKPSDLLSVTKRTA